MMTTIKLYGKMARLFGKVHKVDLAAGSAVEAYRYLKANFAGVDKYLGGAAKKGVGFAIFHGRKNIAKDDLHDPSFGEDIRIAPVILGAKSGGLFQIVLGASLIAAASIATGGLGAAFAASGVWGNVAVAGAVMALGGVIQLLTPRPKGLAAMDKPENTPSYAFNGPVNTTAQGHCVPVLYGKSWTGSAVISAGMDIKDDVIAPLSGNTPPGGGGGGIGGMMGRLHMQLR